MSFDLKREGNLIDAMILKRMYQNADTALNLALNHWIALQDAAGQQWLNDDGVFTLASNPKFVITIDGDATRDGTRITIQEKKAYNEKQKCKDLNRIHQ